MSEEDKLQQQIADIGIRYLKRTQTEIGQLRDCLQRCRDGAPDAPKQLEQLAHKIRGSGAMFGFDALSERANQIETLAATRNTDLATLQRIEAEIQALEAELAEQVRLRGLG
jgi:HPt (histidine-containing phosphotransfer) domain-containing protein